MTLNDLFKAIDAKPFRPFHIGLVSGDRIPVTHPDDIFVLPNRIKVHNVQVYGPEGDALALIWPEGMVGLFFDGNAQ